MVKLDPQRWPAPYWCFQAKPDAEVNGIETNALGFRGPVPPMPKPRGERRIFVTGGSTVFQGNPSLPDIIGEFMTGTVYNFGAVSHVTGQELSLLVHLLIDLKPDLVISYGGGNDLFQPWHYDPRPGYPYNFFCCETYDDKGYLRELQKAHGQKGEEWEYLVAESYKRNLDKMRRIARMYSFRLFTVLQPLQGLDARGAFGAYMIRQYERVRWHVGLDLSGLHIARNHWTDFIHLRESGNRIVAEKIAEAL